MNSCVKKQQAKKTLRQSNKAKHWSGEVHRGKRIPFTSRVEILPKSVCTFVLRNTLLSFELQVENFKTISDFDLIVFSTMLCLGPSDETLTSSAFQAIDLILVFRHLKVCNKFTLWT